MGYALPSWLQKPNSGKKDKKTDKKVKKEKKEKKEKSKKRHIEDDEEETSKKTKKIDTKREEDEVVEKVEVEAVEEEEDEEDTIDKEVDGSKSSKKPFVQPFHNMPLHQRLKIAQEMKIDISELEGMKLAKNKELAIKAGKRPRGKRGGAKSKKII